MVEISIASPDEFIIRSGRLDQTNGIEKVHAFLMENVFLSVYPSKRPPMISLFQTTSRLRNEEEEEADEITTLVLEIHRLSAEKMRLQEAVSRERALEDRDVAKAKAELAKVRDELLELDLQQPVRAKTMPQTANRHMIELQDGELLLEIESAERRLNELNRGISEDEAHHRSEISRLMRRARRAKAQLDALVSDNDRMEQSIERKREKIRQLKMEIHSRESEGREAIATATAKEKELRRLAIDAHAVVSRVYRPKSKYC
jgi:DNA repair exonuclease SbcCD ATPase subunit